MTVGSRARDAAAGSKPPGSPTSDDPFTDDLGEKVCRENDGEFATSFGGSQDNAVVFGHAVLR